MSKRHLIYSVALGLLVGAIPSASATAQSIIGEMRRQATRAELEMALKSFESASISAPDEKTRDKYRADATAIRQRLNNGDFVPGDRILLIVLGDTALSDTFTVRGERRLTLPNIGDLSLQGVLDSELEPYLRRELSRYLRQVNVSATPLVRLQVSGAVPQPNFYTVPMDQAITDVISLAGGTGGLQADFSRTVVRRGSGVFMDRKVFADAVRQGKTVGDMSLRDGDEVFIPDKASAFSFQSAIGIIGAVTGLIITLRYVGGR